MTIMSRSDPCGALDVAVARTLPSRTDWDVAAFPHIRESPALSELPPAPRAIWHHPCKTLEPCFRNQAAPPARYHARPGSAFIWMVVSEPSSASCLDSLPVLRRSWRRGGSCLTSVAARSRLVTRGDRAGSIGRRQLSSAATSASSASFVSAPRCAGSPRAVAPGASPCSPLGSKIARAWAQRAWMSSSRLAPPG